MYEIERIKKKYCKESESEKNCQEQKACSYYQTSLTIFRPNSLCNT